MQHIESVRSARLADTADSRERYTPKASIRTRESRPRRLLARAMIAGAVVASVALPGLTSAVGPARAEAPLEAPGVNTTSPS